MEKGTQEEEARIKAEFAKRNYRRILTVIPPLAMIMGLATPDIRGLLAQVPDWLFWGTALSILSATVIFHNFNWRCPACEGQLPRSILGPKTCPNCGAGLR